MLEPYNINEHLNTLGSHLATLKSLGELDDPNDSDNLANLNALKSLEKSSKDVGKSILKYTLYKPIIGTAVGFALGKAIRRAFGTPTRNSKTSEFPPIGTARTQRRGPGNTGLPDPQSKLFELSQVADVAIVGVAKLITNITTNQIVSNDMDVDLESPIWRLSGSLNSDLKAVIENSKLFVRSAKKKLKDPKQVEYADYVLKYIDSIESRTAMYKYTTWTVAALNAYHRGMALKYSQNYELGDTLYTIAWGYFGGYEALGYSAASGFGQPKLLPSFNPYEIKKGNYPDTRLGKSLIIMESYAVPKDLYPLLSQLPNPKIMSQNLDDLKVVKSAKQIADYVKSSCDESTVTQGLKYVKEMSENCNSLVFQISELKSTGDTLQLKNLARLLCISVLKYSKLCTSVDSCINVNRKQSASEEIDIVNQLRDKGILPSPKEQMSSDVMWDAYYDTLIRIIELDLDYSTLFGKERPIPTNLAIRYGTLNRILLSPESFSTIFSLESLKKYKKNFMRRYIDTLK